MDTKFNIDTRMDDTAIQEIFKEYVASTEGKPRHTTAANQEVGIFTAFCSGAFDQNIKLQNSLYERMMDCAVEFEESGFIAGFKLAMLLTSLSDHTSQHDVLLSKDKEEQRKCHELLSYHGSQLNL